MEAVATSDSILESYLHLLISLPVDSKLALITHLSASVRQELTTAPSQQQFASAFGAWHSEESAEELIAELRTSRVSTRQIEQF